jgi:endonuclease/exonuclease/phosphatase (EEP) superfamily protein YafD
MAALSFVFAALALAGSRWPALDFYGQLQGQAAVACAFVTLAAFVARRWSRFIVGLACVAALGWSLHPYLALPPRVEPPAGAGAPLRIVWANLHNWSTGGEALTRLLEVEAPDVAILTELSENHRNAALAATAYDFRSSFPAGSAFDVMLLARMRPAEVRFDYTHGVAFPVMEVRFCANNASTGCLAVVALHAPRPSLPWGAFGVRATQRDELLALAASLARHRLEARDHVLLLGDFNAVPYSTAFRDLLSASGLADSSRAPAERPMRPWPTWFSSWPGIGLAIDHALVSPGVRIVERRLGPDIGSDHRPLVLHVRLADWP